MSDEDNNLQNLLPQTIGDPDAPDPDAPPEPQLTPEQQELAALKQQLEQMQQAAAEREQRLLDALVQGRAPAAAPQEPQQPASLDLSDLPDPIEKPTDFKTALAAKVNGYIAQSAASTQQQLLSQVTRASALDNMWNRFSATQPDLAKRTALVQGAAALTFQELRARGIDPLDVAQHNPDTLIGAIAQRMRAELGITQQPNSQQPVPQAGARAATVAAGSVPAGGTPPAPQKPPSFHEQHRAAQRALGII